MYQLSIDRLDINDKNYESKLTKIESAYAFQTNLALHYLGTGLHPLQDITAHGNVTMGGITAHKKENDDIRYDWKNSSKTEVEFSGKGQRLTNTKNNTTDYLERFLVGTNQSATSVSGAKKPS